MSEVTDSTALPIGLASELLIDPKKGTVQKDGMQIDLTRTEFRLLSELATDPGTYFSYDHLRDNVWGDPRTTDEAIRSMILQLRSKIGEELIVNKEGFGYTLAASIAEPIRDTGIGSGGQRVEEPGPPSNSQAPVNSRRERPRADRPRFVVASLVALAVLALAAGVSFFILPPWGPWWGEPTTWDFSQGTGRWGEHPEFDVHKPGLGVSRDCEQPVPREYGATCAMRFIPTAARNNNAYVTIPDAQGRYVKVSLFVPDDADTCTRQGCSTARTIIWDSGKASHESNYVELQPGKIHTLTFDGRLKPGLAPWREIGIHFYLASYSGPFYIAKVEVWE
jgi:DNA-binding winged helix-turn-helix (wHTH) protein